MIDKEYLDKLKKEDYVAWDSLVNDPMITGGNNDDGGCILPIFIAIIIVFSILYKILT